MPQITLSDNLPCNVRQLELYELDNVPFDDPGPYLMIDVLAGGETQKREYDLSAWDEPPQPPNVAKDKCDPGSMEAALWLIYDRYQAAVHQHIVRLHAFVEHGHDIAKYVIEHCLDEADRHRVVTAEDYHKIYTAAMVQEVGMEDIEAVLASVFPGFLEWAAAYAGFIRRQEIKIKRVSSADVGSTDKSRYEVEPVGVGSYAG